eukprot:s865_g6.t1
MAHSNSLTSSEPVLVEETELCSLMKAVPEAPAPNPQGGGGARGATGTGGGDRVPNPREEATRGATGTGREGRVLNPRGEQADQRASDHQVPNPLSLKDQDRPHNRLLRLTSPQKGSAALDPAEESLQRNRLRSHGNFC